MRLSLRKGLGGFLGVMALAAGLGAWSGGSTGSGTSGTAGATSAPDPVASAASAASASASASAVTERAKVEAGYRAYWAALEKLTVSGKPDPKVMGMGPVQADMIKTSAGRWILETRDDDRGFPC